LIPWTRSSRAQTRSVDEDSVGVDNIGTANDINKGNSATTGILILRGIENGGPGVLPDLRP
jgi:hypothetical protein